DPVKRTWTTFSMIPEPVNNYKYGLRLQITNMSYPFVGFYNCHFRGAKNITEENPENSRIYLFVNDSENFDVEFIGDKAPQTYVEKGDTALIPCRPTAPDVDVKLNISYDGGSNYIK
uniref:Platelet-derived growth factor receptor alpha-like n=1 Tax=Diabrotica virgifera virgifera TaxID=50390 RepID=A0A6P7HGM9_DIAVI